MNNFFKPQLKTMSAEIAIGKVFVVNKIRYIFHNGEIWHIIDLNDNMAQCQEITYEELSIIKSHVPINLLKHFCTP